MPVACHRHHCESLTIDDLAIDADAAVSINIANVTARNASIEADAATFTLTCTCTKLDVTLATASKVKAENLRCRETHIDAGTASSVHAFASERAVATAGMASKVMISGNPRVFNAIHDTYGSSASLVK